MPPSLAAAGSFSLVCRAMHAEALRICPRWLSSGLSHVDGRLPRMVDVGDKRETRRKATAEVTIHFPPAIYVRIFGEAARPLEDAQGPKGPILATTTVAGVMGAKKTSELLPFCHPLPLEKCDVAYERAGDAGIRVRVTAGTTGKTGVEMEALTAASVAALCVYDMCKALTHEMHISGPFLVEKKGGKSDVTRE